MSKKKKINKTFKTKAAQEKNLLPRWNFEKFYPAPDS